MEHIITRSMIQEEERGCQSHIMFLYNNCEIDEDRVAYMLRKNKELANLTDDRLCEWYNAMNKDYLFL
jgi:hypothetical protein